MEKHGKTNPGLYHVIITKKRPSRGPLLSCVLSLLPAALSSTGCASPGSTVTFVTHPDFSKPQRVAVLPFEDAKGESGWNIFVVWNTQEKNGEAVSSQLAEALLDSKAYVVLERSQLDRILKELDLSATQLVEKRGLAEVGKLLNADAVVLGSVHRFGQAGGLWFFADVSFSARCVDVRSGQVTWSASPTIQAFGNVHDYTRSMCKDISAGVRREYEQGRGSTR